jgi:hypothetical protein
MTINPVSVRGNRKKNCITDPKRGDMVSVAAATLLMIGMVVLIMFVFIIGLTIDGSESYSNRHPRMRRSAFLTAR